MDYTERFIKQLLQCADAAYIVEENTGKVVMMHDNLTLRPPEYIGVPCWCAILGREEKCPFCPKLTEGVRYSWEYYDSTRKLWYKINNFLFSSDGKQYRAGIISTINDPMGLNYDTVNEMTELNRLLEENRRIKEAFEREANLDKMTGLYNRNRYRLDIASGIYDCGKLGILYFDLNNLKTVNDTFRHEAGDKVIVRLAEALKQLNEVVPTSTAYRIGGDEFVLFVRDISEAKFSELKTEFQSILDRMNDGQPILCKVAVGMAYSIEKCNVEHLVGKADKNMYAMKNLMKKGEKNR